ncbi:MAG: UvrD-helicase domain-containing protein, partial [Chloroflexia bacterium]|nr:UvrD-helicase domain-containing protein [Chloroflexia bacterium]
MPLHPVVQQIPLSKSQQQAVQARGRDVVVTAGAGTGKTRTLVARYLSLLAGDEELSPRSIVAITFTQKAAREMRLRVREQVRDYLSGDDLDPQEHERWLGLYGQLDAARIGTIHSLCSEILRAHPAEARVDPRFEVLEEGLST